MLRKASGLLAALAMAVGMVVGVSSPGAAYVERTPENCWWDDGGITYGTHKVCVGATVRMQSDGWGMNVTHITISCQGNFEDDPAVNGQSLRLIDGNGTVVWYRGDSSSNIGGNCYRTYTPIEGEGLGNNNCATLLYNFSPRYNWQPDPGPQSVGKTFCNNE